MSVSSAVPRGKSTSCPWQAMRRKTQNAKADSLMFGNLKKKGFQIWTLHHAEAILAHDMREAVAELEAVLADLRIPVEEIVRGGGGEGAMTQRIR